VLHLHRASRGDGLAAGLAQLLAQPVGDAFTPEVVSVPTRGVERWLAQSLGAVLGAQSGRGDGVCANVRFPFPAALIGEALRAAGGPPADTDPWLPERSVWPLLEVVDASLDEPWLSPLAAHLRAPRSRGTARRFAVVRHVADLFDRYGVHRPSLLRAWAEGRDTAAADGPDEPSWRLVGLGWQAELWRRLRATIGEPSPAERVPAACAALARDPGLVSLPPRLSVFGLTRLPPSYLEVLAALGHGREVHLWLLHPSPALWAAVAARGLEFGPRSADQSRELVHHPLLVTWGRDAREMQLVLGRVGAVEAPAWPDPSPPTTLLGRIQADVRGNRQPAGSRLGRPDELPVLPPSDRSVQVHSCHGRARQVSVLRDAIVHLLEDDPTLEPRDVIVMCPDIEEFAPLIQAAFGAGRGPAGTDLHVRLADRSLRQTNPLLGTLARLLELASDRVSASEVLDVAAAEPVRARFGWDDDELSRMDGWAGDLGVRWGIDAAWREPFKLASLSQGTWAAGIDRLLVGVALSEEPQVTVGGTLPFDDLDSGDIDLAGRLAEFVARLGQVLEALRPDQSLAVWATVLRRGADLLMAVAPPDQWQRAQLDEMLDDVVGQAGDGAGTTMLSLVEVRALLADRLRGVPTRANFRTGHLTVCTLVPMRSVPHRVVCLLGLDDGAFPRREPPDGDDLLQVAPMVGDRDARGEDRQLLLDALMAAGDHLVITYSGRDERTNAPRPPAVPVGELLDVIDQTVRLEGPSAASPAPAGRARQGVIVEHPLQPFDTRNFVSGALGADGPWSYDAVDLAGARARRGPRRATGPYRLERPLPLQVPDPVPLEELIAFVEHPVRAYLRQRLGVRVVGEYEEPGDSLATELGPLDRWQLGDRLLRARRGGRAPQACREVELARGTLPPGELALATFNEVCQEVERLVEAAAAGPRRERGVDVTVAVPVDVAGWEGQAVTVAGTVTEVYGDEVLSVSYSKLGPKQRLGAWVRLLALSAAEPDQRWSARVVGRGGPDAPVSSACFDPLGSGPGERQVLAVTALRWIVDLYVRGLREPLPLPVKTSWAWVDAERRRRDPLAAARGRWTDNGKSGKDWIPGEADDPAHVRVFEGILPFAELVAMPPAADEQGDGWVAHASRLACLAHRLWDPVFTCEQIR
jgi:exodeoxyribonuclease V gamma subunit